MGYTHYMTQKETVQPENWEQLTSLTKRLLENLPKASTTAGANYLDRPIEVRMEDDSEEPPVINDDEIRFNGVGDYGHETFVLDRVKAESAMFEFCKTGRKPYDFVVCSVLILADHFSPGAYDISSDGGPDDWLPALVYLRETFDMPDLSLPKKLHLEWERSDVELPSLDFVFCEDGKTEFGKVNEWF